MPSLSARYDALNTTPAQAAALIPPRAKLVMSLVVSEPPALLAALADRARAGTLESIELYYLLSGPAAACALRTDLRPVIKPMSLFHGRTERGLDAEARAAGLPPIDFIPTAFSQSPRVLCEQVNADVLITTVSPMDEHGFFTFGTNTDYALPVSRTARQVILEVNRFMPRVHGEGRIHLDAVTALTENHTKLLAIPPVPIRPADRAIGDIIAGLIHDGDCLQMGIGAVPDAVCAALIHHQHLGAHTELMTPGLARLMQEGIVDNSRKTLHPGKTVFAFAMGEKPLYDFLDDNPAFESRPVDYTNNPAVIAQNDRMVSVNATLQIDLQGACNSECMGVQQFSAAGGQLDFVRGAYASKGGRSIIACHATAKGGTISRITPTLSGAVTTPRNDTHIVVTEFGWTDLKGKSLRQRADALISLAHPQFREALRKEAVLF
jgi:itaconate CoA-transferase